MTQKRVFLSFILLSFVWKFVKTPLRLLAGKRKTPAGAGFSGEPQVLLSVDTHHKFLFG